MDKINNINVKNRLVLREGVERGRCVCYMNELWLYISEDKQIQDDDCFLFFFSLKLIHPSIFIFPQLLIFDVDGFQIPLKSQHYFSKSLPKKKKKLRLIIAKFPNWWILPAPSNCCPFWLEVQIHILRRIRENIILVLEFYFHSIHRF